MKIHCEKEQAVVAALRSGSLHGELLVHAGDCPFCSEVLLVMDSLREEATFAQDELGLPDAARIWQCAQDLARERAIAKATLPIRIARIFAAVATIFAIPWLALAPLKLPSGILDLRLWHFLAVDRAWSPSLTSTTLLSLTVMLVCIGLSSWYLLQEE